MKTWIFSSLDEETIQGEETTWGNRVYIFSDFGPILPKTYTVFPHTVSPLEQFPHLVRKLFKFSLHKGKVNEETRWNSQAFMNLKKG